MNEVRLLIVVVVLSVLVFMFISLVLGHEDATYCELGSAYSESIGKCKNLVASNKR
jgi:hypothetical protein